MMTTSRPYLLRALNEWILDNNLTPYVVVDAEDKDSVIPEHLAQNGTIVFNISPEAVGRLKITNDNLEFDASFSGVIRHIFAPIHAVLAIYAQENGSGMMFHETGVPGEEKNNKKELIKEEEKETKPKRPALRIIKEGELPEDSDS